MTERKLIIPPLALILGLLGTVLLGAGLYGLLVPEQTLLPILSQPTVSWSLVASGAILVIIETVMIFAALRKR